MTIQRARNSPLVCAGFIMCL